MDTSSISFTALYTGQVWYENGLAAPFFKTQKGRLMYLGLQPWEKLSEWAFGTNLHHLLLQRHLILDHRITQLIETGTTQILEIACGLSPRGHDFTKRFPHIHYIEADLPDMAAQKQALLHKHKGFGKNHRVIDCNILEQGSPQGLDYILREVLDPNQNTLVITEGLINYFSKEAITPFWQTLATIGKDYPQLKYFADCYPVARNSSLYRKIIGPMKALGTVTRANVNPLFNSEQELKSHFTACGFREITIHQPENYYGTLDIPHSRGKTFTRVLEATA